MSTATRAEPVNTTALLSPADPGPAGSQHPGLAALTLAAIGVVYGDIGTSPLYTLKEVFQPATGVTLTPWVLPFSVAVLIGLFAVQRLGTAAVGRWFGPVIVLWFVTLAVTGAQQILREPAILAALNPLRAWEFLTQRGWGVLAAVGAIVLALTGAEALYADMGHFGRRPCQCKACTITE